MWNWDRGGIFSKTLIVGSLVGQGFNVSNINYTEIGQKLNWFLAILSFICTQSASISSSTCSTGNLVKISLVAEIHITKIIFRRVLCIWGVLYSLILNWVDEASIESFIHLRDHVLVSREKLWSSWLEGGGQEVILDREKFGGEVNFLRLKWE